MAFVILKTESVGKWQGKGNEFEAVLKKHARERLPGFACPEWVTIVDSLPVSLSGYWRSDAYMLTYGRAENIDGEDSEGTAAQDCCETLKGLDTWTHFAWIYPGCLSL